MTHPLSIHSFGVQKRQPQQLEGPFLRPGYHFHFVTEGTGILRTDEGVFSLRAGQGFLTFPHQAVSYEGTGTDPWTCLWFAFDGAEGEKICADLGLSPASPLFFGGDDGKVKLRLESLWEILPDRQNHKYEVLSRFYALLACFDGKEDKDYVEKAKEYVHYNYPYPIRVEHLAAHVGLDRTYLFKLFVKDTGVSPQEYLIRYRLERAAELLKKTDLPAARIADCCGFGDAPSFCKHFKARYGCTPLAFRNA